MSKAGKKIIAGAREALRVARGDPEAIPHIKVTPSCGCVFCDLKIVVEDGIHYLGEFGEQKCTRS